MNLAAAFQNIDPFLGGDDRIAVEIGCTLLEFGEILDRFQGALRAEQPLDVHAAERRRIDPMAIGLGTDIADKMRRAVSMTVRMTIEASDATARLLGTAILGLVELLLRERRQQ